MDAQVRARLRPMDTVMLLKQAVLDVETQCMSLYLNNATKETLLLGEVVQLPVKRKPMQFAMQQIQIAMSVETLSDIQQGLMSRVATTEILLSTTVVQILARSKLTQLVLILSMG